MIYPKIKVNQNISLSQIKLSDAPRLTELLHDKQVSNNLLKVPHPYSIADAEHFINFVQEVKIEKNEIQLYAIRNQFNFVIGGVGRKMLHGADGTTDEIGYWLGAAFWNQGIMTAVLNKYCEHCFNNLNLIKIEATIFATNDASAQLLNKVGFTEGDYLSDYYTKGDQKIDAIRYFKNA